MSSSIYVVDSSFKRTQIKVTPGTYLRQILEEACKSRKLDPETYTLKTQNNKAVDLSQPFRLSGLTAGAKLQLTQASRSPAVVSLALQLPESEGGARLSDKFASSTSLWLVLRKYEDGVAGQAQKLNLTQRGAPSGNSGSGRLLYEQPCVNAMGRSLETFTDLQKTLAQLGLSGGSVLLRLTFKRTQQPLEEAMQEISQYFAALDNAQTGVGSGAASSGEGAHAAPAGNLSSVPNSGADNTAVIAGIDEATEPNEDVPMGDGSTAPIVENDGTASSSAMPPPSDESIEDRSFSKDTNSISVYRPPASSTPAAALQPDDPSVFEPSIDHAKAHQAALQRAGRNTRLLSDKELDEQESQRQEKLASVQRVVVRVRYPDQLMIEVTFQASETAADLYNKVMTTLAAAPEPFELRYLGDKGQQLIPNTPAKRLVKDLGFRGRVLVNFAWSPDASLKARQGPSLREEYRAQATELKVELATQQAEGQAAHKTAMQEKPAPDKKPGGGKLDVEAKMKKFLGFGKK